MRVFYIYAPSFDEQSGGAVVLHRLCHLLNSTEGCSAFVVPFVAEKISISCFKRFLDDGRRALRRLCGSFQVNRAWNTPVCSKYMMSDVQQAIVVYPEVTFGNPLKADHVVRWLLHQPGVHTGEICFGPGELFVKFGSGIADVCLYSCRLATHELKVVYYPLELYNREKTASVRAGCCHAIRKGYGKKFIHDDHSVLIDGMRHEEVAKLFKRVRRFVSYDEYTAYSRFAALCGCESIVVPADGVSKEEWYPTPSDRVGIAYGFSDEELQWASRTRDHVLDIVLREHGQVAEGVRAFVNEAESFFFG